MYHRTAVQLDFPRKFHGCLQEWESTSPSISFTYRVPNLEPEYYGDLLVYDGEFPLYALAFYGSATVCSALHFAAWNWTFASPITLWRFFSVAATGAAPVPLFIAVVYKTDRVAGRWIGLIGVPSTLFS